MDDPSLLAPLSSIAAPTSIVHGDQAPVYPLGHGEALTALAPGAVLHVVPGMGHVMTSPGLPEEIADARILLGAGQTRTAVATKSRVTRWTLSRALDTAPR